MRYGLSLHVKLSSVQCPCYFHNATSSVPWPVMLLSSWLDVIFAKTRGALILNGFSVDDKAHELALSSYWQLYKAVAPEHACFSHHGNRLHRVIPFMYHGDEGRGKLKRAVLVTSYVAALAAVGKPFGHSFLSHFLCTLFPGERYAIGDDGVESLESIHAMVAKDLNDLFNNGFEALALCPDLW